MIIHASAPVRVDLAGGWTDVPLFCADNPGYVINMAIQLRSFVIVQSRPQGICIHTPVLRIEAESVRQLEYDGNADLAKAATHRMGIESGLDINMCSDAPPGSGLGTSAAMGVALVGALARFSGTSMTLVKIAEMASAIERHELGILGGKQDQYASALGGAKLMDFLGEGAVGISEVWSMDVLREFEKRLVLCYTGKSRLSSDIHQRVQEAFLRGNQDVCLSLIELRAVALLVRQALVNHRFDDIGPLMQDNWRAQKLLHPSITNAQIDNLFELALDNGATGGKACGAGGGGCLLFYCPSEEKASVLRALFRRRGLQVLDCKVDFGGLLVKEGEDVSSEVDIREA